MKPNWKTIKLSDVIQTNIATYSSNDEWEFVNYLDTGNIVTNVIASIQRIELAQGEKLPSRARRKVEIGDIIYSTVRPNQLHYGFVDNTPDNFLVSTGFAVLHPKKDKIDGKFLYYLLIQDEITEKLQAIAEQRTSAYPAIKPSDIEDLDFTIPDINEQKKISSILSAIDKKIELNTQINHNLEEQAKAIFKSWFVDFEPFGYKAPCTWESGVLGDFVEIKRGGSPRPIQNYLSNSGLRWLKISDATACSSPFLIDIKEHIKESGLSKTVLLNTGALVLSNSATPGIPKILDVDSCIHDGWLYFPKSKLSNEFLFLFFKHIRSNLVSLGNGSVFTNLKTDILKAYPFILPDEQTLKAFNDLIFPVFERIKNNSREINSLAQLRDALLPKLMSGEIDVSEVQV